MSSAPHVALEASLESGLARLGLETFRPGQRQAIETLLEAGRLLLVAPTGEGRRAAVVVSADADTWPERLLGLDGQQPPLTEPPASH